MSRHFLFLRIRDSGFGIRYQVAVWFGEPLIGIPASELANHPEVTFAEFTDAKVFVDQAFTHRYIMNHPKGRQSAHTCTVAPLAGADWTPAQPLPAWVAVVDDMTNADWDKPPQRAGLFDIMRGGADPQKEARQWFRRATLFTSLAAVPRALALLWRGAREAFAIRRQGSTPPSLRKVDPSDAVAVRKLNRYQKEEAVAKRY